VESQVWNVQSMYVFVCKYVCTYVYIYVFRYEITCMNIYLIYVFMIVGVYVYICVCNLYECKNMQVYNYVCT
jgi:hypothetical protein